MPSMTVVDVFQGSLWVIATSGDITLTLWPVTLGLLGIAAWSMRVLHKANKLWVTPTVVVLGAFAFVFFGFPIYAAIFWGDPEHYPVKKQEYLATALAVFWWAYVLVSAWMVVRSKGVRVPVAGLVLCGFWLTVGIFLVAVMGVSVGALVL